MLVKLGPQYKGFCHLQIVSHFYGMFKKDKRLKITNHLDHVPSLQADVILIQHKQPTLFHSQFLVKIQQIYFHALFSIVIKVIATKIFTCHDSWAAVAYAKFCCDLEEFGIGWEPRTFFQGISKGSGKSKWHGPLAIELLIYIMRYTPDGIWANTEKLWKIFTGMTYKLLLSSTVISDIYRSFIE